REDLAAAYRAMGDYEKAEETYLRTIELNREPYSAHVNLGYTYYVQSKYEEAIEPFKRAIELKPGDAAAYNYLGAVYSELEMWPDATRMFERSRAIDSTSSRVISNLGTLYFKQGRFADAERLYRRALDLSREEYKIWAHLAEAQYWNPEGRHKAPENFRRAAEIAEAELKTDSLNTVILSDLASYYEKLGEDARARLLLDKAVTLDTQDIDVIMHIDETYEKLGERDTALEWIARALESGALPSRIDRYPGLRKLRADPSYYNHPEGHRRKSPNGY
ncbi:MAG: hypothetical protein K1000chlam4_00579, partial [Chlamydiae bacterium]|nr:hypothetical protein [Chlamydiota bacterium]